ncbi:UNVERIFIED_CONTAM: hypothetical protein PYX00_010195 [Menopon gallinae]|uniref:Nucleoporin Nup37 n=1 Tax=Menopon gallinae TaxID=328185 RepID=A0AAW2HEK4_9NEOP
MSAPFFEIDFKEKIEHVSVSPFEWSQNLIALAFRNKIVVGIIKFQEDFDDIEQEVEFEPIEEFYNGQRVHALCWSPNASLNKIPKQIEICSANNDFSLRILASDVATKRHIRREIEGHSDYINDCGYDLEGDYLASVSDDLTCKLWSVNQEFHLLNTFQLTSPGMCLSWRHEDPGKLLVGEKKGIIRLYNVLTLQSLNCVICCSVPLTGISWSLNSKMIVILAGGELLVTNINSVSHPMESKMIHPGGGYKVALSSSNDNYVATAGRPGNTLKIIHVKNKQAVVSANLEIFGGFGWHYRLPCLCVGNNNKLAIFKIPAK